MAQKPTLPTKPKLVAEGAESKLEVLPPERAQALFSARMMEEAVSVLRANLRATKRSWSQAQQEFIDVPDCATQVEAARILLAYGIGQPVQRLISVTNPDDDNAKELAQKLKQSPTLRERVQTMLNEATGGDAY